MAILSATLTSIAAVLNRAAAFASPPGIALGEDISDPLPGENWYHRTDGERVAVYMANGRRVSFKYVYDMQGSTAWMPQDQFLREYTRVRPSATDGATP